MAEIVRCTKGHENKIGHNFCVKCGERISGGLATCQHCGATIDSGQNFCQKCGRSINEPRADKQANMKGMRWQRDTDDFATRVDIEDLNGTLQKGIIVEQGTKALLFINGALAETLQSGVYDLGGFISKVKHLEPFRTCTAILVDSGDVELGLEITGIYTKDPLNIDVTCKVIAQINNPTFFFNNVMKGRRSYLISELKGSLYDELQNAFNESVGKKSVEELNWDLSLKRQFAESVENHLRTTFQRDGLNFIQLRTIDYKFRGFDTIRGVQQEVFLLVSEEEAKLQGRKRVFDVFSKEQLQELYEETWKTDLQEKWNGLRERIRQNLTVDKMNEIKDSEGMETFIHEIDKGKLLRKEEMDVLLRTYEENKQDHEIAREFMLKKVDLEHELQYERTRLLGKKGLEKELLENELERKRINLDAELEETRKRREASRILALDDALTDLKIKMAKAQTQAEIDTLEAESGLKMLERMKAIKRHDEYERMEMDLRRKREELKLKIDEMTTLHRMEVEKIEALSRASSEALISLSGPEQARMIAELKETDLMKGLSEEQILAMVARKSPEVAKAFQEKFKGLSSEELKKLYERMITDKDKTHSDHTKMIQEMFNKMAETQRDTAIGVAQGGRTTAVYPPQGQSGFVTGMGGGVLSGEVVVCSKCKARVIVTPGLKFCNNCGNELF